MDEAPTPPIPSTFPRKKLGQATMIAAVVATIILVVAVLPAEYGVDPTGIGRGLGFAKLGDRPPVIVDTSGEGVDTLYAFDLSWQIHEEPVLKRESHLTTSEVQERVEVAFDGTNLTHMSATLRWTDDDEVGGAATEPDIFELSIEAPDGRRSQYVSGPNDANGTGRLEATLQWRSAPTPSRNDDAYVVPVAEDRSAQGPWNVLVRLYAAGGNDAGADPGNGWTLTVSARTFAITNLGTFGAGTEGDRAVLSVEPGAGVEYKFQMGLGGNMSYRWTSTDALTFDFHGDEPGKEDEPTSHKEGTADRDQGEFTAPFSGRHGWWWYNPGSEPVTVTLETSGDYTILGVV